MLDLVLIFSTSGVVLWSRRLSSEADAVARQFVQDVLLSDHAGQATYSRGQYALKWARSNTAGVVFVAAYLNQITLHYVDAFLDRLRSAFLERFAGVQLDSAPVSTFADFDAPYDRILQKHEQSGSNVAKKPAAAPQPPADTAARPEPDLLLDEPAAAGDDAAPRTAADDGPMSALDKLKARGVAGRRGRGAAAPSGSTRKAGATAAETTKPKKPAAKRNWNNATLKTAPSDAPATALDHGQARPDDDDAVVGRVSIPSAGAADDDSGYDTSDVEDDVDGTTRSSVFGYFQGLIGKRLEADDLAPALDKVRTNLMTKNVAADIADDICGSVSASLVGRTLSSLQIGSAVRAAIEETLTRVLSKSHDDGDLLRKIRTVNEQEGRPYSVVFVGVNGVGKSTSLAKICYYLLSKQLTVSLVACDTFRAGAVEQLKTHANALGVELFQRGYNRDPAGVASEGIEAARRAKNNVVLVDTAGRMQDNEPLMRALSKLIIQNRPDLVLFVGEALVGNDGVDQLTKFNLALSDLSTEDTPRLIDGIVLTKFDTIDDKVGAAISMTYTAGIPIMFVGCGQDYADMRRMNVKSVIKKLLK